MIDKMLRKIFIMLSFFLVTVNFSGCGILVPFMQMFKESGLTEGDRQNLLKDATKQFHYGFTDGNYLKSIAYASDEFQDTLKGELRRMRREEKIVEIKNDYVDFSDDANKATVEAYYKYYREGYYIVEERLVAEYWEFTVTDGSKVTGMETTEENGKQVKKPVR